MPDLKFPFEAGKQLPIHHGYWNHTDSTDSHRIATDNFALDFGGCAYFGEQIVAAATGVVSKVVRGKTSLPTEEGRENAGYGNHVELDHGDGYFTRYAHLDSVDPAVQPGATIIRGKPIGKMGDTGYAKGKECYAEGRYHYGVHLHFALFKPGQGVKPEPMDGEVNFPVGFTNDPFYRSSNSPDGWGKASLGNSRWIYWKLNPGNPVCPSGSNHLINDEARGICLQASASACPSDAPFVTVEDAFGGGSESSGPKPVSGGTNSGTRPDLIPNNSDIVNAAKQKVTTLHIGESAYCKMQTKNVGTKDAGSFQSKCFISDGYKIDDNPRDEGKEDTGGLGKNDTHTEYEDFIAPEYPGVYNAVWCTDSAKQVTELNEGNNCHDEDPFTVWSSPNVVAQWLSIQGNPATFTPGQAFVADAGFVNAGENIGRTMLVGWYWDGVLSAVDHIQREHFKAGMSKTETLGSGIAPGTPGVHELKVCGNYDGRIVNEQNPADDCVAKWIEVKAISPDPDVPPVSPPAPPPTNGGIAPATRQLLFD